MSVDDVSAPNPASILSRPMETQRPRFKPVVPLSILGALICILATYIMVRWMTGNNFHPTPIGPTPVPTYMKVGLTVLTVVGVIAWVYCIWHFLIKPWRREGRVSLDGYFAMCFIFIYWLDPMGDIVVPQFTYNSWLSNRGSWLGDTPWVVLPNAGTIAEPFLQTLPLYLWCIFGVVVIANKLMTKAQGRWPNLSNARLISYTVVGFIAWDLFWELSFIRIGYWSYPTTPGWGTIFHDSWYRIHITEPIFWGSLWASWAVLRHFRDDRGQTIAERGVDELNVSSKTKGVMRFLSLFAVVNLCYIFIYIVPTNAFALHGVTPPDDTLKRSYFTNFICGDGTTYACPGEGVPWNRPKSAHLDPAGETVPGKEAPPKPVPFAH